MITTRSISCMAFCLLTLLPISREANAISLDFTPLYQDVILGNTAQVSIRISDLGVIDSPSLRSFDLEIVFDPTMLAFSSVSYGDPVLGDQLDIFGLGSSILTNLYPHPSVPTSFIVNLTEQSFDLPDTLNNFQAGDFLLATLNFTTMNTGNTALGILVNQLLDADGANLALSYAGVGAIRVQPKLIPEPSVMALLGIGLIALCWRQSRRLKWTQCAQKALSR